MKTTCRRFTKPLTYHTSTTIAVAILALAFFVVSFSAQAAEVTIAWDESSENDIASYKVYYGTASRDYSEILNVGNTTQATIPNLQEGITYYIAATACDVYNNESSFSDELVHTVPVQNSTPDPYTISASAQNNGTISPSGLIAVAPNSNQAFAITAATGYEVLDVLVDGASVGAVSTYTFIDVTQDHTIVASFVSTNQIQNSDGDGTPDDQDAFPSTAQAAEVTISWDENSEDDIAGYKVYYGIASRDYTEILNVGNTIQATIPNLQEGITYYIAATACDVYNNESSFSDELVYTVPLQNNEPQVYTISASAGANGTINPSGLIAVDTNSNQAFEITPVSGYEILDVLVNGTSVGAISTYTFTDVTQDHTIAASFVSINQIQDRDGDGVPDNQDDFPLDPHETLDTDNDGVGNNRDEDDDGDGIPDTVELTYGLNPLIDDASGDLDGDGLTNIEEIDRFGSDPSEMDTDGDGMSDRDEVLYWGDSWNSDPDRDGLINLLDPDSDNDGCNDGSTTPPPPPNLPIAQSTIEIGDVFIDNSWTRVNFAKKFENPVVVANPLSFNDHDPAVVRIRNVDPTGFDIRIQEWDYLDGLHDQENVTFLVMERGVYSLDDGTLIAADTFETNRVGSFGHVSFNHTFQSSPVVITSIVTTHEEDTVTGRVRNITTEGFEYCMQEQEANTNNHTTETIHFIAWEVSAGSIDNLSFEVGKSADVLRNDFQTLHWSQSFESPPAVIAAIQTGDGMDTANVRWQNKHTDSLDLHIDEEQSRDTETNHTTEVVGFIALEMMTLPQDSDGDGLDDRDEQYIYGTDPNRADTDNDGIDDGHEVKFWGENWSLDYDSDSSPNILDSDSDGDGFTDGEEMAKGSSPSDPQSKPEVTKIWLEAEDGNMAFPMVTDRDNEASSGEYLWVPEGSGNIWEFSYDSGYAEYDFELSASGYYFVWGRVNSSNGENDSFFVSIDGEDYCLWDTQISNTWVWDQLNTRGGDDPVVYYLEAGRHTLMVKQREDGTKIDKILITDDPNFMPEGLGDGIIPESIKIWLETEDSYLHSPMVTGSDSAASADSYIWVPDGSGNAWKSTYDSGYAEYDFEVPVSGDYLIWGRVNATNSRNNSFFVSIDGGNYALWDTQTSNNWIWDQVNNRRTEDPVVYHLEAGWHTLQIKQREDGTKLDRILVTDDFEYVPD